jgi:hypothetical protein
MIGEIVGLHGLEIRKDAEILFDSFTHRMMTGTRSPTS